MSNSRGERQALPEAFAVRRVDLNTGPDRSALRRILDAYAGDPAGGGARLAPQVLDRLPGVLAACPAYLGLLASEGPSAVGLLNTFVTVSTFKAAPLLNVHDLAVLPEARGRGHGSRLLQAAERIARELGCCKLTLEVLEGNHNARRLYERQGFAAYRLDPAMGNALFMQKTLD